MELNPNNPTTKAIRDQWHAIVAVLLIKFDLKEVLILHADMEKVWALPEVPTVMVHDSAEGLRIKLITQQEAGQLLEMQRAGKQS
jgi:hypothetical protein